MENLNKILEDLTNESKKNLLNIINVVKSLHNVVEEKVEVVEKDEVDVKSDISSFSSRVQLKLDELKKMYDFHTNLLLNDIHEGKVVSDKIVSSIRSLYHSMENVKDLTKK